MMSRKKINYIVLISIAVILLALYVRFESVYIWLVPVILFLSLLFLSCFGFIFVTLLYFMLLLHASVCWVFKRLHPRAHVSPRPNPRFPVGYSLEDIFSPEKWTAVQPSQNKSIPWETAKIIMLLVCSLCGMNFCIMIACVAFSAGDIRLVSSSVRFPLAGSGGIAVDSKGLVYCWARNYQRLQIYDKHGDFIRGWFVDAPTHPNMIVDSNAVLHVEQFGDKYVAFDTHGNLLDNNNKWFPEKDYVYKAEDSEGNVYEYTSRPHRILKTNRSGETFTLVSDPLHLKFVSALFPTMIALFIVLFIVFGYKAYRRREK